MESLAAQINRAWLKLGTRFKTSFYIYLAVVFTLIVLADGLALNFTAKLKQSSFDVMMKHRIVVAKPDPAIVIVDIDEKSLAAMAKDYGRWPWPRQVMGEFLESIEKQHPKSVVFDILYSDPDVYNADSDAYFNAAVEATDNTFFPVLRLDPKSDNLSKVLPSMIPGTRPAPGTAVAEKPVAVVLPFFDAAIKGGRLGLHNIYPDDDGVARRYTVYRNDYGRLIPSLPARLVEFYGKKPPIRDSVLLNWRGGPFTYKYVSFSDVYADMQIKDRKRPQDEFAGKTVIIGSTAASLGDIKPTTMAKLYPGVEILATATDNLDHGDYLREPDMRLANMALALLIILAAAIAMYRDKGRDTFDRIFGASQFLLIGVSYASINLMTSYINLTGPVLLGTAYFTCAKIYGMAARKVLEKGAVASSVAAKGELYAAVVIVKAAGLPDKALAKLKKTLARLARTAQGVDSIKGAQKGIWGLFEGTVVVSWTCPASDGDTINRIREEAQDVKAAAAQEVKTAPVSSVFYEGGVEGGERAVEGWVKLIGRALAGGDE